MTDLKHHKHHALKRANAASANLHHIALTDWSTMGAWVRETARLAVVEHAMQTARERVDGVYHDDAHDHDDAHNDEPGRA